MSFLRDDNPPPLWQILLALGVGALGAIITFTFGAWLIAGFQ